jgi:hypothetical protein
MYCRDTLLSRTLSTQPKKKCWRQKNRRLCALAAPKKSVRTRGVINPGQTAEPSDDKGMNDSQRCMKFRIIPDCLSLTSTGDLRSLATFPDSGCQSFHSKEIYFKWIKVVEKKESTMNMRVNADAHFLLRKVTFLLLVSRTKAALESGSA